MCSAPCFTIIIAWYYATSGNRLFPEPLSSSRLLFSTGRSPDIRWPLHSILILDVKGRPYRVLAIAGKPRFFLSLFSLLFEEMSTDKRAKMPWLAGGFSRNLHAETTYLDISIHRSRENEIFNFLSIFYYWCRFSRLPFSNEELREEPFAHRPSARNVTSLDCTGFEKRRVSNKTKEFYQHERWCILPPFFFFFCRPRIFSIVIVHIFDTWYCNNLYIYQIFCILTYVSVHTCAERMYVWIVGDFYVLCEIFL